MALAAHEAFPGSSWSAPKEVPGENLENTWMLLHDVPKVPAAPATVEVWHKGQKSRPQSAPCRRQQPPSDLVLNPSPSPPRLTTADRFRRGRARTGPLPETELRGVSKDSQGCYSTGLTGFEVSLQREPQPAVSVQELSLDREPAATPAPAERSTIDAPAEQAAERSTAEAQRAAKTAARRAGGPRVDEIWSISLGSQKGAKLRGDVYCQCHQSDPIQEVCGAHRRAAAEGASMVVPRAFTKKGFCCQPHGAAFRLPGVAMAGPATAAKLSQCLKARTPKVLEDADAAEVKASLPGAACFCAHIAACFCAHIAELNLGASSVASDEPACRRRSDFTAQTPHILLVAAKPVRSGALMQQVVSNVLLTGPPVSAFLHSALARSWFKGKKVHYDSVLKYLQRRNLAAHPDELIYITGHSLGGGIANLLGAELGIPSIAFSPPGVQSTATLLEINPARLQAMALDIIPDQDPVSRAAGPHGTVQLPIGCADKGAQCHRIFNSVCELFDMCGDQATPRRKLPCDFCPAKIQQRHSLAPHCARHGEPLEPPPVIL
ncbi:unnamed protein product [Effrenium voratum]|uniref:Fungal lipase-type domain-containing protein n=1 Tax=Effrenium voratum TaxID=2562239 RepID=A0AA36MGF7_9DINO|nr:unnamed protein product [Effrenium voratum]